MSLDPIKKLIRIALVTSFLLITVVACKGQSPQRIRYGKKIKHAQGQPLTFPDFTLVFMGITESPPSEVYPRSLYSYDFMVSYGSQTQMISWSSGTGDIGPALFELEGNSYALELAMSDKLGSLKENELVLWRWDD